LVGNKIEEFSFSEFLNFAAVVKGNIWKYERSEVLVCFCSKKIKLHEKLILLWKNFEKKHKSDNNF